MIRFLSFSTLLFLSLALPAHAAVVAGESCTQLGESTMLTDQTGIAVCARETAGSSKLIWKSMSGGTEDTSMFSGWPDAIVCTTGGMKRVFYAAYMPYGNGLYLYDLVDADSQSFLAFNPNGTFNYATGLGGSDCAANRWSVSALVSSGRAFNFVGKTK